MNNQEIKRFKQDKFYYSFSPLHEPTLRVKSGETLAIEVPDACNESHDWPYIC